MSDARSHSADSRFHPLRDNILVRLHLAGQITTGGVMIPDTVRKPLDRGRVVAVGPGRRTPCGTLIPPSVAPGDEVALMHDNGIDVTLGGEQLVVVNKRDVLGVFAPPTREGQPVSRVDAFAEPAFEPARELAGAVREESLETDVAPDILDREAPTAEDLH